MVVFLNMLVSRNQGVSTDVRVLVDLKRLLEARATDPALISCHNDFMVQSYAQKTPGSVCLCTAFGYMYISLRRV